MPGNPNQSVQPQPTIQEVNNAARALLISQGVDATQQIFQTSAASFTAGTNIINVPVRNVGFIKGFLVEITGTVTPTVAAIKLSPFGLSNLLSNITFTDLSNNVRINTAG